MSYGSRIFKSVINLSKPMFCLVYVQNRVFESPCEAEMDTWQRMLLDLR